MVISDVKHIYLLVPGIAAICHCNLSANNILESLSSFNEGFISWLLHCNTIMYGWKFRSSGFSVLPKIDFKHYYRLLEKPDTVCSGLNPNIGGFFG